MSSFSWQRSLLAIGILVTGTLGSMLPAAAEGYQGASNHNLWHVRHMLERDLSQLQHDQRDYGGYRARAINDLQAARNEIVAAEQYRLHFGHGPYQGAPDNIPDDRGQWSSNRNIWHVRSSVNRLVGQLDQDAADYGGHKETAIVDMRHASFDLKRAEQFARMNGER